jgi:nucleotidyltransferase substrate binding protein (TIGR01987 family)
MEGKDIRWKQRFEHFSNAFKQLLNAKAIQQERGFTELELQGVIQAFEVTQELSWKVLKDFLEEQGKTEIYGSKSAVREAFNVGLIHHGDVWLDMIKSRNKSSHIYDEQEIKAIIDLIFQDYVPVFLEFENKMKTLL